MKKQVLFVSQDQGSGNALYPVIKELLHDNDLRVRVFAARQSKNVFKEQGIDFSDLDNRNVEDALNFNPDLIVTGASMRKCIEKEALAFAKNYRTKVLTILDFWGNYWERFTVNGEQNSNSLPDYICIMDDIAREQMIVDGFPEQKLLVTGNPYFDTFQALESKKTNSDFSSILYISQPVFRDGSYRTDLNIFEDVLDVLRNHEKMKLVVRPHPKDDPDAFSIYQWDNLIVDHRRDIAHLIRDSDVVIGKSSSVLFEAVFKGKPVISYQSNKTYPDWLVTNLLDLSYLVRTKSELERLLLKAINKQLKIIKLGVCKYYNDGKCAERVIKKIKHILT